MGAGPAVTVARAPGRGSVGVRDGRSGSAASSRPLVGSGGVARWPGAVRARRNVVHEAGLFQGRLGFARAVAVVEAFSDLQGVHQVRFAKGNTKETFGDVLAMLRREFG